MARTRILGCLLCCLTTLAVVLTGCSGETSGLPIDAAKLSAYTATYVADDATGGEMQIGLSQASSGNWVVKSTLTAPTGSMESEVNLRDDFTPASTTVSLVANGKTYAINSTYEERKVLLQAETPDGPQSAERNLTRPYYDNEQLVPMLPALQLTPGKKQKFVLVATQSASKLTPTIYLVAAADGQPLVEQVTTPSGTLHCQVIKFNAGVSGSAEQTFWVTTSAPYLVAKIDNGTMTYSLTAVK